MKVRIAPFQLLIVFLFWYAFMPVNGICQNSKQRTSGLSFAAHVFDSFNNSGGGPMLGYYFRRHELGVGVIWQDVNVLGLNPYYRFQIPSAKVKTRSFLQLSIPFCRIKGLWESGSGAYPTPRDGFVRGIQFSYGAEVSLWRNMSFFAAAGMGVNWIEFVGSGWPLLRVSTPNLHFGINYDLPFSKPSSPPPPLENETDPDLWVGMQVESALPVIFAVVRSPGAIYLHPYAEARLTPHVRLQASAWLGPETVIATADTSTRWGLRGIGLAARFHSHQLRRLHFFHTIGLEIVPRQYGQLYNSHIHLANGFSYDIAHRANLEAGMNLRFNSQGYYLAPFLGVAVPLSFSRNKIPD